MITHGLGHGVSPSSISLCVRVICDVLPCILTFRVAFNVYGIAWPLNYDFNRKKIAREGATIKNQINHEDWVDNRKLCLPRLFFPVSLLAVRLIAWLIACLSCVL